MVLNDATKRHWRLVLSGFERLHDERYGNVMDDTGAVEYEYATWFVFANHIRDYLVDDQGEDRAKVRTHVESTLALSRCSDLCNATKHSTMTSRTLSDMGPTRPSFSNRGLLNFSAGDAGRPVRPPEFESVHYFELDDGGEVEALQLAHDVLRGWGSYGLPLNPDWAEKYGV